MEKPSTENQTPKRAPRRRVAASRANRTPRKRVSERRAERRAVSAAKPEVVVPDSIRGERKAPTPLAAHRYLSQQKKKQALIIAVSLLVGVGASAAVGLVDQGQIDVKKTIEARNERIRNNQADDRDVLNSQVAIPVQDTSAAGKADGGLVGRGETVTPPEPASALVSTSTATSTSATASSTEAVASSTEAVEDAPEETAATTSEPTS